MERHQVRIWHKTDNIWFNPEEFFLNEKGALLVNLAMFTVEEFTNMLDTKGKQIFVGDIVKCWDGENGVVYFDKEQLQYRVRFGDGDDDDLATSEPLVMGNIHEGIQK